MPSLSFVVFLRRIPLGVQIAEGRQVALVERPSVLKGHVHDVLRAQKNHEISRLTSVERSQLTTMAFAKVKFVPVVFVFLGATAVPPSRHCSGSCRWRYPVDHLMRQSLRLIRCLKARRSLMLAGANQCDDS